MENLINSRGPRVAKLDFLNVSEILGRRFLIENFNFWLSTQISPWIFARNNFPNLLILIFYLLSHSTNMFFFFFKNLLFSGSTRFSEKAWLEFQVRAVSGILNYCGISYVSSHAQCFNVTVYQLTAVEFSFSRPEVAQWKAPKAGHCWSYWWNYWSCCSTTDPCHSNFSCCSR